MAPNSHLTLRPGEPVGAAWRRVVALLFRRALQRLRHPSTDPVEDLHAARVAIKHLRALLRMVRPVLTDPIHRREDRRLATAAQHLSELRDADVGRHLLTTFGGETHDLAERIAFENVCASYDRAMAHRHAPRRAALVRSAIHGLENSRRALGERRLALDDWTAFAPGLEAIYRSCRRRVKKALRRGEDRDFHRWRMRLKNLLHVLQFLLPLQPRKLDQRTHQLADLHHRIGTDHDLAVLGAALRKTGAHTASLRLVLQRVNRERRCARLGLEELASRALGEKPRAFLRGIRRGWMNRRASECR